MPEPEKMLILGGCRSGKSRFARNYAESREENKVFIATLIPQDEEMKERVKRHRLERGKEWNSVEAHVDLAEAVEEHSRQNTVLLVDCLTLWISNLFMEGYDMDRILQQAALLCKSIQASPGPVVLVSNEVGSGIVPDTRLGRDFRDAAGLVNQKVASAADTVIIVAAGIPCAIKGGPVPENL
jgi:adenosylcobinamide kinase/adenosylcobinamide-phosphate guanylyltransferase